MEKDKKASFYIVAAEGVFSVVLFYAEWTNSPVVFEPLKDITPAEVLAPPSNGTVLQFMQAASDEDSPLMLVMHMSNY